MRRVAVLSILVFAVVAACGREDLPRPSEAFCRAAYEYDQEAPRIGPELEHADAHVALVEPMDRYAPDDIADDTARFLDALRRVADGDTSVVDDPEVQASVERINRRAANGCALFDQEPPGGL